MQETERCPCCGAKMKKYWHRITPGLVGILIKCYDHVKLGGHNRFRMKDLKLTHSEYGNFQKLRFHGLIAKYRVGGEWLNKEWVVTKRGAEFLCSRVSIPVRVQTFRNQVVEHDPQLISIRDVYNKMSGVWFENEFEYSLFEPKQEVLV